MHTLTYALLCPLSNVSQVGDFVLLTHDIGLSVPMALAWNFLAGTSVIIGGLIAVGVDISDESTGGTCPICRVFIIGWRVSCMHPLL